MQNIFCIKVCCYGTAKYFQQDAGRGQAGGHKPQTINCFAAERLPTSLSGQVLRDILLT